MQMPGLLVEYFITGSVALIWLSSLLNILGYTLPQNSSILTLFIPGIYVLGMLMDFVSGTITRPLKRRIQNKIYKELRYTGADKADSHIPEIQSFLYVPEMVKAIEMRRSRARIARSTTVNCLLTTLVFVMSFWKGDNILLMTTSLIIGGLLTFICFMMWARYQRLSESFEIESMKALGEKIKKEKKS